MAAGDKLSRAGMKASGVRRVVAMERVLAVARVDAKIKATAVHHEYGQHTADTKGASSGAAIASLKINKHES